MTNAEFDATLKEAIEQATDIHITYRKNSKDIATYNQTQRKEVHEYLKEHDCKTFIQGVTDGYLQIVVTKENYRLCKYCGNEHETKDANLLCPECRQTFGHTLYSEL